MAKKSQTVMVALLITALIVALGVFVYVNLPKGSSSGASTQPAATVLTVTYNGHQTNYTLQQLESLESFTAQGGYRTSLPAIRGQGTYTGVRLQTLIDTLGDVPSQYSIIVHSTDHTNQSYNYSTILGDVPTYDPTDVNDSQPIGHGGLTMVLAYKYEGSYFNQSKDGILKIVFLDDQGSITSSKLWWKYVDAIQVISE